MSLTDALRRHHFAHVRSNLGFRLERYPFPCRRTTSFSDRRLAVVRRCLERLLVVFAAVHQFELVHRLHLQLKSAILVCAVLVFLANSPACYPSATTQFVVPCVALLAQSQHPIIRYLGNCVAGDLLVINGFDTAQVQANLKKAALTSLFIYNQQFPTERIANAVATLV